MSPLGSENTLSKCCFLPDLINILISMFMSREKRQREGRWDGGEGERADRREWEGRDERRMEGRGGQGGEERRVEGISVFFGPTELPVCYLAPLPLACVRLGTQIPSATGRNSWPLSMFITAVRPQGQLSSVLRHVLRMGYCAGRSRDRKILSPPSLTKSSACWLLARKWGRHKT